MMVVQVHVVVALAGTVVRITHVAICSGRGWVRMDCVGVQRLTTAGIRLEIDENEPSRVPPP